MSKKIKVALLALGAVTLISAAASAQTFHKGLVLAPNGSIHRGWVSLASAAPNAYAARPFAHDPTMYAVRHNIPVPPVQLPGGGRP